MATRLEPEASAGLGLREVAGGVRFELRVKPRASKAGVLGVREEALVVAVQAPPVEGAANEELRAVIAKALDLPKRDVTIAVGEKSKKKIVEVRGLTPAEITTRLGLEAKP